MISVRFIALVLILAYSSHLTFSLSQIQDRRKAIQQAGVVFGASTGLIAIPTRSSVALAESVIVTNKINPIATLSDGSKFPLASFGLQWVAPVIIYYPLVLDLTWLGSARLESNGIFSKILSYSPFPLSLLYIHLDIHFDIYFQFVYCNFSPPPLS